MASSINASTSAGLVSTADTSGVLQLQTANTTAVSISAAQVVNFTNAIGISGDPLGGNGGVFRNIELGSSGTNTTTITGQTNSAAGGIVVGGYLTSANTLLYNVYSGQQPTRFNMNDGAFIFSNAPNGAAGTSITLTEQMRLNKTGALVLAGGSTTANGVGVTFPATQSASTDANTLDDYEEGTWTPSLKFGGNSVGQAGAFEGNYVKVGKMVTCNGRIILSAKGSSTGAASITGLPFTTAASNILSGVSYGYYEQLASSVTLGSYVSSNATSLFLINATGTTITALTDTSFNNTARFDFAFIYFV